MKEEYVELVLEQACAPLVLEAPFVLLATIRLNPYLY
jgi:hypothetical protein